jgi:formylglycine-generating enzyme required for sulfatase activity
MKKSILFFALVSSLLVGCYPGPSGELVGVYPREEWVQVNPYGMNYINFGSFTMGNNDRDLAGGMTVKARTVTVSAFYMDQHEISNNEYRQFVFWVRDSLMRDQLAQNEIEGFGISEREDGREMDRFINKGYKLDWETEIDMENDEVFDIVYDEFYLQGADKYYDRKEIDSRKLKYRYWWIDFEGASKKKGNRDEETGEKNSLDQLHSIKINSDRTKFVIEEQINVYPDTLVWAHDFTYSNNTHLTETYFWHPAYDDYPVVGVTWGQCQAFCAWRTQILNEWKQQNGETFVQRFRLPSEAEWEYASRGGLSNEEYPWGGPYTRNYLGCPLANFKPMRGDYPDDNGVHTVPIGSYSPNGWGLYNMAGNVAEWCNTAYDEGAYEIMHDLNPEYDYRAKEDDATTQKRKVTRGGSWKDISYFIQCGTRSYEFQDTAKSYIGFRCAMTYLGRGKSGPSEDWNSPSGNE